MHQDRLWSKIDNFSNALCYADTFNSALPCDQRHSTRQPVTRDLKRQVSPLIARRRIRLIQAFSDRLSCLAATTLLQRGIAYHSSKAADSDSCSARSANESNGRGRSHAADPNR